MAIYCQESICHIYSVRRVHPTGRDVKGTTVVQVLAHSAPRRRDATMTIVRVVRPRPPLFRRADEAQSRRTASSTAAGVAVVGCFPTATDGRFPLPSRRSFRTVCTYRRRAHDATNRVATVCRASRPFPIIIMFRYGIRVHVSTKTTAKPGTRHRTTKETTTTTWTTPAQVPTRATRRQRLHYNDNVVPRQ